jgi:hypothetical protein
MTEVLGKIVDKQELAQNRGGPATLLDCRPASFPAVAAN